jgi:hypothetical protein
MERSLKTVVNECAAKVAMDDCPLLTGIEDFNRQNSSN